ncbi:MAG: hypothetical protein K2M11_03535 [Paramuribaculum sp.]|nr:hypothetical protein [Paramuribaculum sp.]
MALAFAGATTVFSCSGEKDAPDVIFANNRIKVSSDSVAISGHLSVKALDAKTIVVGKDTWCVLHPKDYPVLTSGFPLLDAAFSRGMQVCGNMLADTISPNEMDLAQILAILNPGRCEEILRTQVVDSLIIGRSPVYTGRGLWVIAAVETAFASGNTALMEFAAEVGKRTLDMEWVVGYNSETGLVQGAPSTRLGANSYLPRWMNEVERFGRMTLMGNVVSAGAYKALSSVYAQLGKTDSTEWLGKANQLSHAININLWQPDAGQYNRFLYGGVYTVPVRMADNVAQPLAVLANIPIPEMADKVLSSTPWNAYGMPMFYPSPAGSPLMGIEQTNPRVQTLWALAAAHRGNETVLSAALANLLARSFGEVSDSVASVGAVACVLRGFAGMKLTGDALEFAPVVPSYLKEGFEIRNFKYRNADYNIAVKGCGNRVERFAVDGKVQSSHRIDGNLTGKHIVTINMAGNKLKTPSLPAAAQVWAPPVPEIEWLTPRIGRTPIPPANVKYALYADGYFHSMLDSLEFHLPVSGSGLVEAYVIPISNVSNVEGFGSAPHYYYPAGSVRTLQAEDFAPGGTTHIRDWRPSFRYVESTPDENPCIEFVFELPASGRYAARLCYANGNGAVEAGEACALRILKVNDSIAGTFVLPARGAGWWLSSAFSNALTVSLHEGENRITVEYDPSLYPGTSSSDVLIDFLRLTKMQ